MKKIKYYLLLQGIMIIYSLGSIASKLASNESFLSFKYIFFMFLLFMSLAIYAITWQQILKKVPLSIAYVNKVTTIIWTLLISVFIFNEETTLTNIIGIVIIFAGMIITNTDEARHE